MTASKYFMISLFMVLTGIATAQSPTQVPKPQDNSPLDLSDPFELLVLVILPILFIVLFFVWRGKRKKDAQNNNNS